jgi:hypothetical protein
MLNLKPDMRIFSLFLALFLFMGTVVAQDVSFGFKAGLNFSTVNGPSEMDSNGSSLEEVDFTRGFQFGPIFNLKFNDVFGVRAELLYSQKGGDYSYNGQSFWVFYPEVGDPLYHIGGNRNMKLFVTNSYLDLPITAVVRWKRLEVSAGVNAAVLLTSRALGEVTYTSPNIDPFTIALEYNYGKDEPTIDPGQDPMIKSVTGQTMLIPNEVGAYYGSFGRDDKLYNAFDFGLNAGLAVYLSKGLFLGVRMNYGLTDITREEQDFNTTFLTDDNKFITKNDEDKNVSIQASVGFSF